MDREALNDFPLGRYDVTVQITEYEQDRLIAWTILGQIRPQIGHVYGYRLEPAEDGTVVDVVLRLVRHRPALARRRRSFLWCPEAALRATLGMLDRTVRRGYPRADQASTIG